MDRPVGVVGAEHVHDRGDIGPAGVHHEEVPGRGVEPGRQVGGHDDGPGPVDDQGLLVGVGVGGRRPDDLDPVRTQVLVCAGVGALLPLVQDDPDPYAALGGRRQVMLGLGVGELKHGHVDAVPGVPDETADRPEPGAGLGDQGAGTRRGGAGRAGGEARKPSTTNVGRITSVKVGDGRAWATKAGRCGCRRTGCRGRTGA
jgi:hypothetical protein